MRNKMKHAVMLIVIFGLFSSNAIASREGVLPFSKFKIESNGIAKSGLVIVTGTKDSEGSIIEILVKAFGKEIYVPKEILTEIPPHNHNGIQLSYEAGYKNTGGRTVYLMFQVGFTSGVREIFIIAVNESGEVRVIPNK